MSPNVQILIVDDEPRFLDTLAQRLRIRDFRVIASTNGLDALKQARGHQLDLALIDLKMPWMDGEELLSRLKKEHPLMEVIILTGHGSEESRETCRAVGAFSYLHKPCETQELVAVLRAAFERRMTRRLEMKHSTLQRLVQRTAGESSFQAILRLKALEEELLAKEREDEQT